MSINVVEQSLVVFPLFISYPIQKTYTSFGFLSINLLISIEII